MSHSKRVKFLTMNFKQFVWGHPTDGIQLHILNWLMLGGHLGKVHSLVQ